MGTRADMGRGRGRVFIPGRGTGAYPPPSPRPIDIPTLMYGKGLKGHFISDKPCLLYMEKYLLDFAYATFVD